MAAPATPHRRSGAPARDGPRSPSAPEESLLSIVDRLPAHGGREAYLWRDGVRWRARSYTALHAGVLACAARLAREGVRPGDPVLIQGPDHPDWVEALLGTLRAGAVAVPLDTASPAGFRTKVAQQVGARALVAMPGVEPPAECRRIDLGSWRDADVLPGTGPVPAPRPEDRAEIVFTSGTTGEPRGVVLTHRNLVSDFAPLLRVYRKWEPIVRVLGTPRFLSTLPLSHMFGQATSVFLSLAMGLSVVFVPPRPRDILQAAKRRKAWGLFTVPRVVDLLGAEVRLALKEEGRLEPLGARTEGSEGGLFRLKALAFPRARGLLGRRFRLIVSGGAPLPEAVQRAWENLGYLVVQGYGLTETAPIVSISNPFEKRAGSVGRPIAGQEVRIGEGGEVLVRGPNVTPGYLGAEGAEPGGWFRTGDVGEIDAAGRLHIRGRVKDLIVTPEGENVYPDDVEAAFRGVAGVREACVIGLPVPGGERVHAVLLLDTGKGIDPEAAVRQVNERLLPRQRVRDHTVWPEEDLPRTATGKVRKAVVRDRIQRLQQESGPAQVAGAPPATRARRLIAEVARVRLEKLQETTRLVEGLGLGSLDLVELAGAFERELGVSLPEERLAELTVGDLETRVRELASSVGATSGGASVDGAPAVPPPDEPQGAEPSDAGAPVSFRTPSRAPRLARPGSLRMPRWAYRWPAHLFRRLLEELWSPVVRFYGRPQVIGLEHLREAEPPFLFVVNHHSYVDTPLFKAVLPLPLRGRIAPGMTTRYHRVYFGEATGSRRRFWREGLTVCLVEFLVGAWPLPETAGFLVSLSFAGELADAGFSLLLFPEGRHVPEGRLEPFRKGIGIFARELRAPVFPVAFEGTAAVFPDGARWPRIHPTRIVIGAPLRIDPGADAAETASRLHDAVRALGTGALRDES